MAKPDVRASIKYPIYDPQDQPFRGYRSATTPMGVPPGVWYQSRNLRWFDDAAATVAAGPSVGSVVTASGSPRGLFSGYINGTWTLLAAIRSGASTIIKYSTDNGANWSTVSATSPLDAAAFSTDAPVEFAVTRHPSIYSNPDRIVVQNGTDSPLVLDPTNWAASTKHAAITADDAIQDVPVIMEPVAYYNIQAATTDYSEVDGGGTIVGSSTGSAANYKERITITNAVTTTKYCTLKYASSKTLDASTSRQLWIVAETDFRTFFDCVKVSVKTSGGTEYVIYDPSSSNADVLQAPVFVDYDGKGKFLVGYDIQHLAYAGSLTINRILFTWVEADTSVPSATRTVDILMIGYSGLLQGTTSVGSSRCNPFSLAHSPGIVHTRYQTKKLKDVGGPTDNQSRLPISPLLFYKYNVPYTNVSSADMGKGIYKVRLFGKMPGDTQYRYLGVNYTAGDPFGGPPTFISGSASQRAATPIVLNVKTVSNYNYILPSAFYIPIPIGKCLATPGQRLAVGAINNSTQPGGVYFSEIGNGFSFLVFPDPEMGDISAASVQLPSESVAGLLVSTVSTAGTASLFAWSTGGVYHFNVGSVSDIYRYSKISPHGTIYNRSIVEHYSGIYWMDNDRNIRVLRGGSVQNISYGEVNDKFVNINGANSYPYAMPTAWVYKDRYYIAHIGVPDAGPIWIKNSSVQVYNLNKQAWESEDRMGSSNDIAALVMHNTGSSIIPYFLTHTDCKLCIWEGDTSTQVAAAMKTGYIHSIVGGPLGEFTVGPIWAVVDTNSGSLASGRTFLPNYTTLSGSYDVTLAHHGGSNYAWVRDTLTSPVSGTARGKVCYVTIYFTAPPGTKIYRLEAELYATSGAGTV